MYIVRLSQVSLVQGGRNVLLLRDCWLRWLAYSGSWAVPAAGRARRLTQDERRPRQLKPAMMILLCVTTSAWAEPGDDSLPPPPEARAVKAMRRFFSLP